MNAVRSQSSLSVPQFHRTRHESIAHALQWLPPNLIPVVVLAYMKTRMKCSKAALSLSTGYKRFQPLVWWEVRFSRQPNENKTSQ